MNNHYNAGFSPISQDDVNYGDEVYIDSYQNGEFPEANPKICGPFIRVVGNGSGRCFQNKSGRTFMHYPDNLLVKMPIHLLGDVQAKLSAMTHTDLVNMLTEIAANLAFDSNGVFSPEASTAGGSSGDFVEQVSKVFQGKGVEI